MPGGRLAGRRVLRLPTEAPGEQPFASRGCIASDLLQASKECEPSPRVLSEALTHLMGKSAHSWQQRMRGPVGGGRKARLKQWRAKRRANAQSVRCAPARRTMKLPKWEAVSSSDAAGNQLACSTVSCSCTDDAERTAAMSDVEEWASVNGWFRALWIYFSHNSSALHRSFEMVCGRRGKQVQGGWSAVPDFQKS
jgi:hypothetical protein